MENQRGQPSLQSYVASSEGEGRFAPSRTLSFGGMGGITGNIEQERMTAERSRFNELEENERRKRALNFYG